MNTTTRHLVLALPLAAAALTLTVAPASAESVDGPVIGLPTPDPQPEPPVGPGEITNPTPGDPDPIDDLTNPEVDDEPNLPDGPGTITNPAPCPTHGTCGDEPGDEPGEGSGTGDEVPSSGDEEDPAGSVPTATSSAVEQPTRIDAGAGAGDEGMSLGWLLASGAIVTATGAAFAARRRLA